MGGQVAGCKPPAGSQCSHAGPPSKQGIDILKKAASPFIQASKKKGSSNAEKKQKAFQIVEIYLGHTTQTESGPPFSSKQECFGFPINLIISWVQQQH